MCPKCAALPEPYVHDSKELLLEDGTSLEIVNKFWFCYLGDMIVAAEDASRTRVRCGWKKFNELAPVLTLRIIVVSGVRWFTAVTPGRRKGRTSTDCKGLNTR